MSAIETAFVFAVTTSASFAASLPRAETSSPGGTRAKIATTGSDEEGERHARRENERRAEERVLRR